MFNDEYYQVNELKNEDDNDDDKPVFTDDDEEDLKCSLTSITNLFSYLALKF